MTMTQKPISLEVLSAQNEALCNALQIICTGLSKEQQKDIATFLEQHADTQFATPLPAHMSDEAKKRGASIFKGLAGTIRRSLNFPASQTSGHQRPLPQHALAYQQPSRQKDAGGELPLSVTLSGVFLVVGMRATLPAHICDFCGNGHTLGQGGTRSALAVSFSNDFGTHGNLPNL